MTPRGNAPRVSLIIATYNWPDALDLVLDSACRQSWRDYEIVIADDGSRPDTATLIAGWTARAPVPIVHSWQEDRGYRLARSRNLAVTRSRGDYLIMLDGDCLLLPNFVATHMKFAERGWFTAGRRCYLRRWLTRQTLTERQRLHTWPRAALFPTALFGGSNRPLQLLPLPQSDAARRKRALDWDQAQGCNLGVWREDFIRVGGFDEGFEGWGLEDTDLVLRLLRGRVRRLTLQHAEPVLHLWHKRRSGAPDHDARLEALVASDARMPGQSMFLKSSVDRISQDTSP